METRQPSSDSNVGTIVKAQIVFLLSTLSEENFERNQLEIRSVSASPVPTRVTAQTQPD